MAACTKEPVHLVGHSYGGAVALRFAMDRPQQVATLTLIEPASFNLLKYGSTGDRAALDEIKCLAGAVWHLSATGRKEDAMARFVDFWNGPGAWDALGDEQQQRLSSKAFKVARDFMATIGERSALTDIAAINVPTAVVTGAESPLVTQRIARLIESAGRDVLSKTIIGAGHMLPLTHGERLAGIIAAHMFAHPKGRELAA